MIFQNNFKILKLKNFYSKINLNNLHKLFYNSFKNNCLKSFLNNLELLT